MNAAKNMASNYTKANWLTDQPRLGESKEAREQAQRMVAQHSTDLKKPAVTTDKRSFFAASSCRRACMFHQNRNDKPSQTEAEDNRKRTHKCSSQAISDQKHNKRNLTLGRELLAGEGVGAVGIATTNHPKTKPTNNEINRTIAAAPAIAQGDLKNKQEEQRTSTHSLRPVPCRRACRCRRGTRDRAPPAPASPAAMQGRKNQGFKMWGILRAHQSVGFGSIRGIHSEQGARTSSNGTQGDIEQRRLRL